MSKHSFVESCIDMHASITCIMPFGIIDLISILLISSLIVMIMHVQYTVYSIV